MISDLKIIGYSVVTLIKESYYAKSYRVKDKSGRNYFLKLIDYEKVNKKHIYEENELLEVEILKRLNHPNITKYHESGIIHINLKKYIYLVCDYISGETAFQHLEREGGFSIYYAKKIIIDVLKALSYLHKLSTPVIHNEITTQNIMLDLSKSIPVAKLIDFKSAQLHNSKDEVSDLNTLSAFYKAPEAFNGVHSIATDIYSVGALLYNLIFRQPPYFIDISNEIIYHNERMVNSILSARQQDLPIIKKDIFEFDKNLKAIIEKALNENPNERFKNAEEFISALENNNCKLSKKGKKGYQPKLKRERGFAAIAGMNNLKHILTIEVINAIKEHEKYSRYGLTIPNGILLYGPPGCGKTFFAKHLAEEIEFNFIEVKPSAIKSKYVNASQENISKLFQKAVEESPTIIFFDEINELVPKRDSNVHEMSRSVVNEMLAQMDRTGEKGVFIIGATNFPDMIDEAILRSGRIDKKYYIGPPDDLERKELFKMYLKNRPCNSNIDYNQLSKLTKQYIAADIKLIVDDASRQALINDETISEETLEENIRKTPPSISVDELSKYSHLNSKDNSKKSNRPKIGFN